MLVGVYTCQNATLLEISCHGSNILFHAHQHLIDLRKQKSLYVGILPFMRNLSLRLS